MMDFENLRDIENSNQISKIKWLGVPAWDFLRFRISQEDDNSKKGRRKINWKDLRDILKFFTVLAGENKEKHLFLGTNVSRYLNRNGLKDPWCDPIIEFLDHKKCLKFYEGTSDSSISGWPADSVRLISSTVKYFGPQKEAEFTAKQIKALCDEYDIRAPSVSRMASTFLERWAVWVIYCKLFKILQPQSLFVVCSYGKESQIIAAKSLGIPVLELQHGVISERHFGYSFPYSYKKQAFPDFIFTYGPYWRRFVIPPISTERMIDIGFAWGNKKSETQEFNKKVVLFISQWTHGDEILNYASSFSAIASDHKIQVVVRLHPRDKIEEKRRKELENKGILIQEAQSIQPYDAIERAAIVVGVSSTMIFEAISMGKPGFIINSLIDPTYMSDVPRVDTPHHLLSLMQKGSIEDKETASLCCENFFSRCDPNKILETLGFIKNNQMQHE